MTYVTSTTVKTHSGWLDVLLAIVYTTVIGAVAYALPLSELLNKVTR